MTPALVARVKTRAGLIKLALEKTTAARVDPNESPA